MENDQKVCAQCGKEFTSVKDNTKFCSEACRKAYARQAAKVANLTLDGHLIRGQHEGDVAPTGSGILVEKCRACGQEYRRWMESKLARLVRNELEGSVHWGSREEFGKMSQRFNELMKVRVEEVKYCSPECQQAGPAPQVIRVAPAPGAEEGIVEKEVEESEEVRARPLPKRRGKD